jgi:hypothetical protein
MCFAKAPFKTWFWAVFFGADFVSGAAVFSLPPFSVMACAVTLGAVFPFASFYFAFTFVCCRHHLMVR